MTRPHKSEIEQEEGYIAFLEKRLASQHFKENAAPAEYEDTKERLKKARFKLKTMKARK